MAQLLGGKKLSAIKQQIQDIFGSDFPVQVVIEQAGARRIGAIKAGSQAKGKPAVVVKRTPPKGAR